MKLLSYIIATKNKLPYLKMGLEKLIANKKPDEEILVADGASTDGTKEYLERLRRDGKIEDFISEPDYGLAHALNKLVLRSNGELLKYLSDDDVFDYKTRRAMTPAAIKGETKNDEGNYFRQLVFYKMLSQNDFYSRNKKLQTSLVFVSPDDHGRCPIVTLEVNQSDIKKVENEIKDLIQCVWSGEIVQKYCTQPNCRYCGYRKLVK